MHKIGVYYSFPAGGIGRYNQKWLECLAQDGDLDLEFICLPEFAWELKAGCRRWSGLFSISSQVPTLRRTRFLIGQFVNPLRAIARLRQTNARLIHFTDVNHLSFPFWKAALDSSGMKVVISAHDICRAVAVVHRAYEESQLRAIYRRADAIQVHAVAQADELVEFAGVSRERVHVVPHGPYDYGAPRTDRNTVRERLGIGRHELLGLCFGQLRDDKNLSGLLRAMAMPGVSSRLVVSGAASSHHRGAAAYEAEARGLGIADRVVFDERFIPDEEVAEIISAADWIGLPYPSAFTSQSGVLNLAAQYRRPVLVGAAPALGESVRCHDIGAAAVDNSDKALHKSLLQLETRLLNDDPQAFGFGAFVAENTWEENARRTAKLYRNLLDGGA